MDERREVATKVPDYPMALGPGEKIPRGAVCLFGLAPEHVEGGTKAQPSAVRAAVLGDERPTYAWMPDERLWVLVDVVRSRADAP